MARTTQSQAPRRRRPRKSITWRGTRITGRLADVKASDAIILNLHADSLSPKQFGELLAARHVVAVAVKLLAHKHPNPEELRFLWSRIALWLEDAS